MDGFWELVGEKGTVQAIITLALVGVSCYLWAMGLPVPPLLAATLGTVMGFWFGTKSQQYLSKVMAARQGLK